MIEKLSRYFATQPVERAWLFGSYARGEETPDSDVDILVSLDRKHPRRLKIFRYDMRLGEADESRCGFGVEQEDLYTYDGNVLFIKE